VISGAARGNEVTPLHQSGTASVDGIREQQCIGKRWRHRGASLRYHNEEKGTAGNINAPKAGRKRNTEM